MFVRPGQPIGRLNFMFRGLFGLAVIAVDVLLFVNWVGNMRQTPRLDQLGWGEIALGAGVVLSAFIASAFIDNAAGARCIDLGLSRNVYLFGGKGRRDAVLLQLIFAPGRDKGR